MDHNNNDKGMKSMMWMMAICCGLPLLLFLFVGAGGVALGASKWLVIGFVGLMVVAHLFMMRKGHGGHSHESETRNTTEDNVGNNAKKDSHSGHNCCH